MGRFFCMYQSFILIHTYGHIYPLSVISHRHSHKKDLLGRDDGSKRTTFVDDSHFVALPETIH